MKWVQLDGKLTETNENFLSVTVQLDAWNRSYGRSGQNRKCGQECVEKWHAAPRERRPAGEAAHGLLNKLQSSAQGRDGGDGEGLRVWRGRVERRFVVMGGLSYFDPSAPKHSHHEPGGGETHCD